MKSLVWENAEAKMLDLAMPHIRKICHGKWSNLEPEDRVAEAAYFFVCAFRSIPIGTGHFMSDYEKALTPYMDEHNRKAPPRYYCRNRSLDKLMPTKNSDDTWSLYDILPGTELDETSFHVTSFLKSLPDKEQAIVNDLMIEGLSKASVARKHKLSGSELAKILNILSYNYQQSHWSENKS